MLFFIQLLVVTLLTHLLIEILNYEEKNFTFNDHYSSEDFQEIKLDSGAAGALTTGEPRFRAHQKLIPLLTIDESTAGQHKISFGKEYAASNGTTVVLTPPGHI